MTLPPEVSLAALYFNGLLTLVVATVAFLRRRLVRASVPFFLVMLAASWWSITYAIMLSRPSVELKIFWSNATYFAIVFLPVLWLVFALEYAGLQHRVTRRNLLLIDRLAHRLLEVADERLVFQFNLLVLFLGDALRLE